MAAEVGGGDSGKKGKKGRKKKSNPRIDMTPMVDLGFLLLTFFVLTARLNTPTTMPVVVPADEQQKKDDDEKVSENKVLNILLSGSDRVYWYKGVKDVELNRTFFESGAVSKDPNENTGKGIRKVIFEKKEECKRRKSEWGFKEDDPLIVLIKMTDDATYKNMVDILDEMNITDQGKYMLIDSDPNEVELIKAYEESNKENISVTKTLDRIAKSPAPAKEKK